MKTVKLLPLIAVSFVVSTIVCACSTQTSNMGADTIAVRVVVTQSFGQELMFDERLEVMPNTSAMAALMQIAEVETAYGGGFVNGINGVRSGYTGKEKTKMGWFFYVNGIQSNTGALDYKLNDGNIQHCDFHDWSFQQFIPAIVGHFPEPFYHGYGGTVYPTIIVYQSGWERDARRVADRLESLGVESVSIRDINRLEDDEKESCNMILLGTTDLPFIAELNHVWKRLGFFTHLQGGLLEVLDSKGEPAAEYGAGCGVIQATQSPWNPKGTGVCENAVWIVSGSDTAGVKAAVDALVDRDTDVRYAYTIVISDGEIVRVPQ
jgi:hypothetical protein